MEIVNYHGHVQRVEAVCLYLMKPSTERVK